MIDQGGKGDGMVRRGGIQKVSGIACQFEDCLDTCSWKIQLGAGLLESSRDRHSLRV